MNAAARLATSVWMTLVVLAGCAKAETAAPVSIEISHFAGAAPLQLGSAIRTSSGDELIVDKLRYYLSNLRLRRSDGGWYSNPQSPQSADGYFLIDEAVPASKKFSIGPVPDGDYSGIEFLIGVDEARNHSGAQSGALDPARGMFWTWHSGYVFFKLEGHSPQSPVSGQTLAYHVGGGDVAAPLARTVYLPLPEPVHVRSQLASEIHLDTDAAAVFGGAHPLRIAELPEAMEPPGTVAVADNFAAAFRVDHVHNLPRRAGSPGSLAQ